MVHLISEVSRIQHWNLCTDISINTSDDCICYIMAYNARVAESPYENDFNGRTERWSMCSTYVRVSDLAWWFAGSTIPLESRRKGSIFCRLWSGDIESVGKLLPFLLCWWCWQVKDEIGWGQCWVDTLLFIKQRYSGCCWRMPANSALMSSNVADLYSGCVKFQRILSRSCCLGE